MNIRFSSATVLILMVISGLVSCTTSKELTRQSIYFKNLSDSLLQKAVEGYEPTLQKGDILYIGVITPNEKSSRLFNQPNFYGGTETAASGASSTSTPAQGYLIDEKGNIIFPYLGSLKAAGLTKSALTDTIRGQLAKYVDSAIVSIRLLNYRVTVLGEVARPGTYSIPSERVTILDAIGLAGDLTVYGRRNNIRIIRNIDGERQTSTLNLNDGNIFGSPFFYLRQNDIVYVEMNERKIANTDQANIRTMTIILGIVSTVSVALNAINAFK